MREGRTVWEEIAGSEVESLVRPVKINARGTSLATAVHGAQRIVPFLVKVT